MNFTTENLRVGNRLANSCEAFINLQKVGFLNLETTDRDQIIKSQFMNAVPNDLHCQLSVAFQYKIDDASLKNLVEFTTNWERNGRRAGHSVQQVTMVSTE